MHAYNRTIVELKFKWVIDILHIRETYNRTIVELKFEYSGHYFEYCDSYNRTIVELKYEEIALVYYDCLFL